MELDPRIREYEKAAKIRGPVLEKGSRNSINARPEVGRRPPSRRPPFMPQQEEDEDSENDAIDLD